MLRDEEVEFIIDIEIDEREKEEVENENDYGDKKLSLLAF